MFEWEKALAPGRRVAPGRRARQLWLMSVRWLGCALRAWQQPLCSRKHVQDGLGWLCAASLRGFNACCDGWCLCALGGLL